MVKAYLRYQQEKSVGVITSPYAPIAYDETGEYAITPALDQIAIWSLRQNKLMHVIDYKNFEKTRAFEAYDRPPINITALTRSNSGQRIAAGFQDGRVVVFRQKAKDAITEWDLELNSVGHTTAVSCLTFSDDDSLLASGSDDTDIIVWDVVASTGQYRYV